MNFKKTTLTLAIASSLALVGCSGGGSSSAGDSTGFDPGAATVSGSAVKGLMKFATVTAFELNSSGERIGSVGTAETNADGEYELSLSDAYQGGLLEIEVTVNDRTRMVCDANACGTKGSDVELPAGFKLTAIAAQQEGANTLSAPITAWSTMASKRTRALIAEGKSASDANRQAVAEVNQVAGFDVSRTSAKAVTNLDGASAAEQQAAVMNAVVAELIFAGGDAATGLDQFASALDDGVAGNDGDSFSSSSLASTTQSVVDSQPDLTPEAKDSINGQVVEYQNNPDGVEPTYDETLNIADGATQAEKIEAFKTFVSQVRTWGASIESLDSEQLQAVIGAQVETFQNVLGTNANSLQMTLDIAGQAFSAALSDPAATQAALTNGTSLQAPLLDGEVEVGSLEIGFADEQGLVMTVTGAVTGAAQTAFLPFNLTLNTDLSPSALSLEAGTVSALADNTNIVLSGTFSNGSGVTLASLNDLTLRLDLNDAINNSEGLTDSDVNTAFVAASFNGDVELRAETGESFTGNVEARIGRLTANRRTLLNDVPASIERLQVSGDFSNSDGSVFRASAALNVNNSASFDTFAWLDYSEETVFFNGPVDASGLLSAVSIPGDAVAPSAGLETWRDGSGTFSGFINASWYLADGAPVNSYRYLQGQEVAEASVAFRQALIDQLPASLTLSYYDNVAGTQQEAVLDVAEAIGNASIQSSNVSSNFGSFVSLALLNNPLPEGVTNAEVTSGLGSGESGYLNVFDDVAGQVVSLELYPAEQAKMDALLGVFAAQSGLTDIQIESADLSETSGYGNISMVRPANLAYYEECLADPAAQLVALGGFYYPEFNDAAQSCASATLTWAGDSRDATSQELAVAESALREALITRYGEFAGQSTISSFYLSTYGVDGFAYSEVELPDLENADNFIDASFTVATSVNLPELPEAKVSATVSRSSFAGGRVRATVGWDSGQYSLELASSNADQLSEVTARFFNPQGYELQLAAVFDEFGELAGLTGDALINGEDIGDVVVRNGAPVITYPNGSTTQFETLF